MCFYLNCSSTSRATGVSAYGGKKASVHKSLANYASKASSLRDINQNKRERIPHHKWLFSRSASLNRQIFSAWWNGTWFSGYEENEPHVDGITRSFNLLRKPLRNPPSGIWGTNFFNAKPRLTQWFYSDYMENSSSSETPSSAVKPFQWNNENSSQPTDENRPTLKTFHFTLMPDPNSHP